MLQNLVGNAVKFTERGYVHVKASHALDPDDPGYYLVSIQVVDSGIGVIGNAVSTPFTPFTRFADSTTRRYQGTGLGLSICKSLTELMNGTVGFHANPDGPGSVFLDFGQEAQHGSACLSDSTLSFRRRARPRSICPRRSSRWHYRDKCCW